MFRVEIGLTPEEGHPWESLGVPLAVIGFKDDWTLDFIDRSAVLRLGGQPKPRTLIVPASGTPLLWQARVAQFMEHLTALPDYPPATFVAAFRQLPPVGFLPAAMIDVALRRQAIFPPGFSLGMAPVPLDQIDFAVGGNCEPRARSTSTARRGRAPRARAGVGLRAGPARDCDRRSRRSRAR